MLRFIAISHSILTTSVKLCFYYGMKSMRRKLIYELSACNIEWQVIVVTGICRKHLFQVSFTVIPGSIVLYTTLLASLHACNDDAFWSAYASALSSLRASFLRISMGQLVRLSCPYLCHFVISKKV